MTKLTKVLALFGDKLRIDYDPLTPRDIFRIENKLSDAEVEYIKSVYVKGKTTYVMPNNEIKQLKF